MGVLSLLTCFLHSFCSVAHSRTPSSHQWPTDTLFGTMPFLGCNSRRKYSWLWFLRSPCCPAWRSRRRRLCPLSLCAPHPPGTVAHEPLIQALQTSFHITGLLVTQMFVSVGKITHWSLDTGGFICFPSLMQVFCYKRKLSREFLKTGL